MTNLATDPKTIATKVGAEDSEESLGELQVAEYIVFLLAVDTYMRYVEETVGAGNDSDPLILKGLRLLRLAEPEIENIKEFLAGHLPTDNHKRMLDKAIRIKVYTQDGAARRALQLRTVLSRGGAVTMRAVFQNNRALRAVREAINASMLDDADAALDKFAAVPMRNLRVRDWIDLAAETAGSGETVQNSVEAGSKEGSSDHTNALIQRQIEQAAATGADSSAKAQAAQTEILTQVESDAASAAKRTMEITGEEDRVVTKSETVGIAVAAAAAATSDLSKSQNVPEPLRGLDDEQRAAAMTDGRVKVGAGAGSGKSTTSVARVAYLVKDRRVLPSRILVTSFNTKAAGQLKERIGRKAGGEALQQMSVGTMHSLFRKFIGEYGTPEEKIALGLGKGGLNGFVKDGLNVARTVQRMWQECFGDNRPVPQLKKVLMLKSQWAGNNISPAQALAAATSPTEVDAATWYEMYEGLKGSIPGWKAPCKTPSKAQESFMARTRPNNIRLGDFSDMLSVFLTILKRQPAARKTIQQMYDHIICDEAQDRNTVMSEILELISEHITDGADGKSIWLVGDPKQCVSVETPINLADGTSMLAGEVAPGTLVKVFRNGQVVAQPINSVTPTFWIEGYKITTASGKTLTMSPNHKIWTTSCPLSKTQYFVYLMYRSDMGYRVGMSKVEISTNGGRLVQESADRLWILDVVEDKEEALERELGYSLEYAIPTCVFKGVTRGLNQVRINKIYQKYGENGGKLLATKGLDFNLPHKMGYSASRKDAKILETLITRRNIQFLAHRNKGSILVLEWSGADLAEELSAKGYTITKAKPTASCPTRYRIRHSFHSYRSALDFGVRLSQDAKASLSRRLSIKGEAPLTLITAAGVFPGMKIPVLVEGDVIKLETVTEVEKVLGGNYVDLDVGDASNFFGDGILSHNSINEFMGAKPALFTKLSESTGWKERSIRTNYRCEPEIIDAANKLIAHNPPDGSEDSVPSPQKIRGVASIKVESPTDEAEAALAIVEEVKSNIEAGERVSDHAVLCRTNKELHAYETACIIRGVPYARKGASSFLGSPETKTFLSYVQLATGSDFEKLQKSLGEVINRPNRFFIAPDAGIEAVAQTFSEYARLMGLNVKNVNPIEALQDRKFVNLLAQRLVKSNAGFKFDKASEKIRDLADAISQMQANTSETAYKTTDLFDDILNLNGTAGTVQGGRTVYVTQTLRETLKQELRDAVGDDDELDEDEDDSKGLGNIAFLYELAKKDPTDPSDLETDPNSPLGFKAKMERYAMRARELRIDLIKWDKEQGALPPEQRTPPPGIYLGTVHCSPPDEPILTTKGWISIGELNPKIHTLASHQRESNQLVWGVGRRGYPFVIGHNSYAGDLIIAQTVKSRTRVTPNHRMLARFSDPFFNKFCVYLMRRGNWWRVGMTATGFRPYRSGTDIGQRLSTEKADGAWILKIVSTRQEAVLEEARIQGLFGLVGSTFEVYSKGRKISNASLHALHESLKEVSGLRARELLKAFGLYEEYPLFMSGRALGHKAERTVETLESVDKRSAFVVRACNLMSDFMDLPVVSDAFVNQEGERTDYMKPDWYPVSVTKEPFEGQVYSLTVTPYHHYISGGVIVHNSTKGAEWSNTYVSMPKGKFPFEVKTRPGEAPNPEQEQEQLESERRLAYVALTRAAKTLTIVCPKMVGGKSAGISSFVAEAGLKVGENVKPEEGLKTASFEYEGHIPDEWANPTASEILPEELSTYDYLR